MSGRLEIMAPAGNFECLAAAIQAGADSVYFGVGRLNMRSHSAANFSIDDLPEVCALCRKAGIKSYLALNVTLYGEELDEMRSTLDAARKAGVSAVIASDMAAILYARQIGLEVHISTQLSISNVESLRFYAGFADVVVLARELNLNQVAEISRCIDRENITGPSGKPVSIEMFAHGALCMAVSGKCHLSLHCQGASANRGSCYQICRRSYRLTDLETGEELRVDNKYILSPKDLCTISFLNKMAAAGVSVFKIEGRARSAEYVQRTVSCYRRAADAVCNGTFSSELTSRLEVELREVFNRGFWNGWYQGAEMAEWSSTYGTDASRVKINLGRIGNWFPRLGVAEISLESSGLEVGDEVMTIGATSGVNTFKVTEIRLDLKPVQSAPKGSIVSIPVPLPDGDVAGERHPRRGDRIYLWRERGRS